MARPLLVVAILGTFGMMLGHGLVYDAPVLLARGDRFALPIQWSALLTESYWYTGLWRPVTLLLLGVEVHLAGGVVPAVLHATSLVLYTATVLLLMRVTMQFGARVGSALTAALIFAVHPVHVEVIASVVGQAEMLAALAMLGAVALWHRATVRGPSQALLVALLTMQLCAAGAKEQGYVLPMLLVGQHWLIKPRLQHRLAMRWLTLVVLVAVAMWCVRATVTGSWAGETPAPYFLGISAADRFIAALGVLPHALGLLSVPIHLGFEYGPPGIPVDGRFGWAQTAGLAMIIAWGMALWRLRVRAPVAAFGLWWVAITWLPASSLLVPAGLLLADRVLFLPTIGLAFAIASIPWPAAIRWSRLATVSVVVVSCLFAIRSRDRLATWRDADTFFTGMTADQPDSYRGWFVRGNHARDLGLSGDAERYYREAIRLWPFDPSVHEELGQLLRLDGRCSEAIPTFRAGLALDTTRFQIRAKLEECERQTGAP